MFSKLLKYDLKSLSRSGLIVMIITFCLGAVGAIDAFVSFRAIFSEIYAEDASVWTTVFSSVGILSFFFILFGILVCSTVMQIIIYVNYYKALCTDQGYLTFTLPVKERDILLSKTVSSFIWNAIITVAIILCIALIILSVFLGVESVAPSDPMPDDSVSPLEGLFELLPVALMVTTVIFYSLNNTQLIFMVIFFASVITKKNKGLLAVGLVLGANMIYSMLSSIVSSIIAITVSSATVNTMVIEQLIYIVFLIGTGIAYFFLTEHMMKKKLNLP